MKKILKKNAKKIVEIKFRKNKPDLFWGDIHDSPDGKIYKKGKFISLGFFTLTIFYKFGKY